MPDMSVSGMSVSGMSVSGMFGRVWIATADPGLENAASQQNFREGDGHCQEIQTTVLISAKFAG